MPDAQALAVFVPAALVLLVTPGPGVLYVVARSLAQGRLAGFVSVLGLQTGTLVHIALVALGASALLAASPRAFAVLKLVGGAYLVWLGVQQFRNAQPPVGDAPAPQAGLGRIYRQAIVVEILNPNTALFFLAFLPQFAKPERGPVPLQMVALGLLFVALALVGDGSWAFAAGSARGLLKDGRRAVWVQRHIAAPLLVLLGILAIVAALRG